MTASRPFRVFLLAAALAAGLGACREASTPDQEVAPPVDTSVAPAAPPAAAAVDTAAVDLRPATSAEVLAYAADGAAPLTIVNFWATWCVPCIVEFPDLVRAGEALRADGVRLVFVSADDPASRPDVRAFLARHGVQGRAFQKDEPEAPFIEAFAAQAPKAASGRWSGTLPATFVYDRAGKAVAYFDRPVTFEVITDTARALLRTASL